MQDNREVQCEKDVLQYTSGSVAWRQGGTEILAAVHGPQPAQQRRSEADRAVVSVSVRPRSGPPGNLERLHEAHVQHTVEACAMLSAFPQSVISIALQVIKQDGGLLAAYLNAACAALMDAGIPMYAPFAAVTSCSNAEAIIRLHPDAKTEEAAAAVLTASFSAKVGKAATAELGLLNSQLDGRMTPEAYLLALNSCHAAIVPILDLQRKSIEQAVSIH